jgi:hypothetical protein
MPYYGKCARCDASWRSKKFASSINGEPIPVYARQHDLKFYSEINDRLCLGCRRIMQKKRPQVTTQSNDTAPMSRQQKVAIGDGLRRMLREDGIDNRVEVPSARGPPTTWEKKVRPRVDNNNCSAETLRLRAKTMESEREWHSTLNVNADQANEDSIERLRVAEVKRQPEQYISAMKEAGLTIDYKLSANETVQLQILLGTSTRTMRILRSFLQQHGINVLESEKISRHHVTQLRHEVETGVVDWQVKDKKKKKKTKEEKEAKEERNTTTTTTTAKRKKKKTTKVGETEMKDVEVEMEEDNEPTMKDVEVPFARVVDVAAVLNSQLDHLIANNRFKTHGCIPDKEVWCSLIGDKGGNSVKLGVNIINNEAPLSRSSVYILAMYEGAGEDYELIRRIMQPIIQQVYAWRDSLLETKGLTAKVFSGGDFPWMSKMLGLSDLGQFFCIFCLCSQQKLQKDRGNSHSPEKERCELRTHPHHCEHQTDFERRMHRSREAQLCFNCINPPLLGSEAYSHTSVMPLHTFLGIGGEIPYDILKRETAELDKLVQKDNKSLKYNPKKVEYKRPFTTALDALMKDLCVSRKGNRGHTLVGNDVHTMLQPQNRERLCAVLNVRKIGGRNRNDYGNADEANKLRYLLEIISDMYFIATTTRALTGDEISGLTSLANELAEWYPKNYPNRTITPKFHVATHHLPEFAATYRTVGLVSEHCLEATHAEFKKYDQRFACDGNGERALASALHQNLLEHDARLGTFSLQRRVCPDCGSEIRQLGKRIRTEPDIVRCKCVSQSQ